MHPLHSLRGVSRGPALQETGPVSNAESVAIRSKDHLLFYPSLFSAAKTRALRSVVWPSPAPPSHVVQGAPALMLVAPAPHAVLTRNDQDLVCYLLVAALTQLP